MLEQVYFRRETGFIQIGQKLDKPTAQKLHINYKEVLAVTLAVKQWAGRWQNMDALVITDSTFAKAIINKGTCRNKLVMAELRDLFWLSVQYNFKMRAIHIPGVINQLPDSISRLHEPGQLLRLHSLLSTWNHANQLPEITWSNHMSLGSLQVIQHQLERWHYRLV